MIYTFLYTYCDKKHNLIFYYFNFRMLSCALFSRVNVIKTEKKIKKKDGTSSDKKSDEKTESTKKSEPAKESKPQKDEKIPSSPKAKKVCPIYLRVMFCGVVMLTSNRFYI